jgi:putative transposase
MPHYEHGHLLRAGRVSQLGNSYLITCVVKDRLPVFNNFHVGRMLVRELKRLHESGAAHSLAWVVMPDHMHWLFELKSGSLATLTQLLKGRSSFEINKAYGAKTLAWQRGYYDKGIRTEKDLIKAAHYVIANPIRAGLVEDKGDYPLWDSNWT